MFGEAQKFCLGRPEESKSKSSKQRRFPGRESNGSLVTCMLSLGFAGFFRCYFSMKEYGLEAGGRLGFLVARAKNVRFHGVFWGHSIGL